MHASSKSVCSQAGILLFWRSGFKLDKLQAQIRNVLHIWILLLLFVNDELQPGGDLSPPNYNPLLAQSLKSRK